MVSMEGFLFWPFLMSKRRKSANMLLSCLKMGARFMFNSSNILDLLLYMQRLLPHHSLPAPTFPKHPLRLPYRHKFCAFSLDVIYYKRERERGGQYGKLGGNRDPKYRRS